MTALCALFLCLSLSVSAYVDADGGGHGITASGARTRPGTAACGPSFPFGMLFLVDGQPYICLDRGSAITDGYLDLWVADEGAAWQWGRRQMTVVVKSHERRNPPQW